MPTVDIAKFLTLGSLTIFGILNAANVEENLVAFVRVDIFEHLVLKRGSVCEALEAILPDFFSLGCVFDNKSLPQYSKRRGQIQSIMFSHRYESMLYIFVSSMNSTARFTSAQETLIARVTGDKS